MMRLVGLIVEFHDMDHLRPVFERCMRLVLERFELIHLQAHNWPLSAADGLPEVLEETLIPRGAIDCGARRRHLPVGGLDKPNKPGASAYRLTFDL